MTKDVDTGAKPGAGRKNRGRRLLLAGAALAVATAAGAGAGGYWIASLGPAPLSDGLEFSIEVVDRNGQLLRPYATAEGRWRLPARSENVDQRYIDALLAYEDKRFRSHHGVDPLAMMRAAVQLVLNGRIVSGGSTLTMQVARLIEPRRERNLAVKLKEMVRAVQ